MQADKFCWPDAGFGQTTDGQSGGVGSKHAVLCHHRFSFSGDLRFEVAVLKHRFNHQIAALQIADLVAGVNQGVHLRLLGLVQIHIHDDAGNAFLGRGQRDARSHHAGTQDAYFGGFPRCKTAGSGFTSLDGIEVEEERCDHVLGGLTHHQLGQFAALDAGSGVVIDLCSLDHGL